MKEIRNFTQARALLSNYAPKSVQEHYTLDRMRKLMRALGDPQNSYKVVHIAGTSGKSSTAYYIAALLSQTGKKVGLTVSPHVDEVNERVQINLVPLTETIFCIKLKEFIDIVDQTDLKPSYFEIVIAFAYWLFAHEKVDYAVVEVGLGGLMDSTNVVNRDDKVCVITDIGLDHTQILGNTLSKIARQKAGIIQYRNQVFMHRQMPSVMRSVSQRCKLMSARLHELAILPIDKPVFLPPFQQRNWILAKVVFEYIDKKDHLKVPTSAQFSNASHIRIPARLEVIRFKDRTIIIDGSHNGQKMAAAIEGIRVLYPAKTVIALVSFVESERERAIGALEQLKHITTRLIVTSFNGEQDTPKYSVDPNIIAKDAKKLGFEHILTITEPEKAFAELLKQPEDILLVTGSFYLLNHIRPVVLSSKTGILTP
jgi:dihydrofolate synthase/folylpolyglutamate synthase